jgi:succinoglycan biosynthesis protein ExoO
MGAKLQRRRFSRTLPRDRRPAGRACGLHANELTKPMPPSVSVIIAAYNVEAFIARAVESATAQTVPDIEILVVDDASSDATAGIVENLAAKDSRIRLLRQETNRGPSAARNRALGEAVGAWIAVLDADDAWLPERLEKLLAIAAETQSDAVADNQILFDHALQQRSGLAFDFPAGVTRLDAGGFFAHPNPLRLGILKFLFNRDLFGTSGFAYDESMRFAEDFRLLSEILLSGREIDVTSEAYYVYTTPVGHLSRAKSAGTRSVTSRPSILALLDTLEEKYRDRLTPSVVDGLRRCRAMTIQHWTASEITRLRRESDFGRLAMFLLGHPLGALRYLTTSSTWKRLGFGKATSG